jgi:hypothetical protein
MRRRRLALQEAREAQAVLGRTSIEFVAIDTEALERLGAVRPWILPRVPLWRAVFHLEAAANLLELLERVLTIFSKRALKSLNSRADFDSAIRRFDPSRPSQPFMR